MSRHRLLGEHHHKSVNKQSSLITKTFKGDLFMAADDSLRAPILFYFFHNLESLKEPISVRLWEPFHIKIVSLQNIGFVIPQCAFHSRGIWKCKLSDTKFLIFPKFDYSTITRQHTGVRLDLDPATLACLQQPWGHFLISLSVLPQLQSEHSNMSVALSTRLF